jgi:hypothetical protein
MPAQEDRTISITQVRFIPLCEPNRITTMKAKPKVSTSEKHAILAHMQKITETKRSKKSFVERYAAKRKALDGAKKTPEVGFHFTIPVTVLDANKKKIPQEITQKKLHFTGARYRQTLPKEQRSLPSGIIVDPKSGEAFLCVTRSANLLKKTADPSPLFDFYSKLRQAAPPAPVLPARTTKPDSKISKKDSHAQSRRPSDSRHQLRPR